MLLMLFSMLYYHITITIDWIRDECEIMSSNKTGRKVMTCTPVASASSLYSALPSEGLGSVSPHEDFSFILLSSLNALIT